MQQSLIIGFGKAGRELHLHCLRKAYSDHSHTNLFDQKIGVVDPYVKPSDFEKEDIQFFSNIEEVAGFDPKNTVVHICTPPEVHSETLKQVAELGFTKCMMEKPLATSKEELASIHEVIEKFSIDLLVVANWLSSTLTSRLVEIIKTKTYGQLLHIVAEQNKARLSRTMSNHSHGSAFDVEIPHLMALALYLGGTDVAVVSAKVDDMHIGNLTVPHMGQANISLLHHNGMTSELLSNLKNPIRERCIRLYFKEHRVLGYYPSSKDDSYSWIKIYSASGKLMEERVMYDDPLSSVFTEYYQYFDGSKEKPVSDVQFNSHIVKAICQAKESCGLMFTEKDEVII
ncbi:Gfo/Idh/MocA family protein [Bacillus changyiensis]|uniref:Gfo/Idh/MocA family protein n=1 Tax=Bacillus changyiensis TaxID=3004103 RepID=UPI0022E8E8EE|nr:Gfo/Idh/MocA family oxidoreductase [Bacillus changyiensis]MDA1478069.1 Gfo/Idh/MocA family oxidoreductase [Bacillus changyiensis]